MAKLYFRYGAMNCGKTTALLQVAHNYRERGMKVLIAKPMIDTKGGRKIVSRLGIEEDINLYLTPYSTITIEQSISYIKELKQESYDCILVDEAQFLEPYQVDELYKITKSWGIPVICYGLRCDFQMKGFPGAIRLLEIADSIEELKTICRCGDKATQNMRLIDGVPVFYGEQVAIDGENDVSYESVCGKCYLKRKGLLYE